MDTSRLLVGIICAGLLAGCADQSPEVDGQDLNVAVSPEEAPNLPLPPPGATCALIQRGTLGQVGDSDIGYGDGSDLDMGAYPFSWTGASPYDHWSAFQFDMKVVPANKVVVQATFSVYASWNMESSNVRAHRIKSAWSESTVTWEQLRRQRGVGLGGPRLVRPQRRRLPLRGRDRARSGLDLRLLATMASSSKRIPSSCTTTSTARSAPSPAVPACPSAGSTRLRPPASPSTAPARRTRTAATASRAPTARASS